MISSAAHPQHLTIPPVLTERLLSSCEAFTPLPLRPATVRLEHSAIRTSKPPRIVLRAARSVKDKIRRPGLFVVFSLRVMALDRRSPIA